MILDYCNKYKYLGNIQNDKNNMKDHIQALKGKVEAAYQTILAITRIFNLQLLLKCFIILISPL